MFGKDTRFAFEKTRPAFFWSGTQWRADRRACKDSRIGRRRTDSHFPFAPAFVVQALAQCGAQRGAENDAGHKGGKASVTTSVRYSAPGNSPDGFRGADRGRYLKLRV